MNRPTLDEVTQWPATCSVEDASRALGISRSHGYGLVKRGEFPVRVIKAGARFVVSTAHLTRLLSAEAVESRE